MTGEPMSLAERVGYLERLMDLLLNGTTDLDTVRFVYTERYLPGARPTTPTDH